MTTTKPLLHYIVASAWATQLLCIPTAHAQDLGASRAAAIAAARAGQFDTAISSLSQLSQLAPQDMGIQADRLEVMVWSGRKLDALANAKKYAQTDLPTYSLKSLARAARDVGSFEEALAYYAILKQREPSQLDAEFGEILTRIDAGQYAQAEAKLAILREQYPENPEVYRAMAYLGEASAQPVVVADASMRLLEINPQDNDAAHALAKAAGQLGATPQAMLLIEQKQLKDAQTLAANIQQDGAAHHIRWAGNAVKTPAERFVNTDTALATLDKICACDWHTLDLTNPRNQNLLFDRMIALRDRYRMDEVIAHHSQLQQAHVEIPDYILNVLGDAYLYKRMPEQALTMYEASLKKAPQHVQTQFSKFHTLIELERFDEATTLIDSLAQNEAVFRNRPKNPVVRNGEYKLEADLKSLYARAYGDDLQQADSTLTDLAHIGPWAEEVLSSQTQIWRWRGWPERAQAQAQAQLTQDPEQVTSRIELAHTHMDLREWQQAESSIQALAKDYPEKQDVQALEKRLVLRNDRQLVVDGHTTESSGGTFGSRYQGLDARLYSSPFTTHYRAFVGIGYNHATFPEGDGNDWFPGVGLEYTDKLWRLSGEISQSSYHSNGVTGTFTADYRLDDYWSFSGLLDLNSNQMPLRGKRVGTNANLLRTDAVYRWSDLTRASAGLAYMDMSDGNQRTSVSGTLDRRLHTQPHYKLTAHLRADASHNTKQGVAYFNPKRDMEYGAVLDNEWMQWRRYERSFSHRLQLGLGNYWQQDFGSMNTWMLNYEQQIKWDDRIEFAYGAIRNKHPYDGINEYFTQYYFRLNFLF